LAISAVVEGSATVLMARYMATQDLDAAELSEAMAAEMEQARMLALVPRYFSVMVASYICGMHFMVEGDLTALGRPDAGEKMRQRVLRAASAPPRSSEQVLHPAKYWREDQRDEPLEI